MKKRLFNVKCIIAMFVLVICSGLLSGCASGAVNYYLTSFPSKLVYEVGEELDLNGLKVESINSDGTNTMVPLKKEYISEVDTSSSGIKKVKISNGKLSTVFNVYVADIVITDSDNLKEKLASAKDGDIVYLKKGNYVPKNNSDTSYKDVVIDKSIVLIGDGSGKTKFAGNFVVGAKETENGYEAIENFGSIKIMNIGFNLTYKINNGIVSYNGPYGNSDKNGALNIFNTQNILVFGCSFSGYAYGILANNAIGLTVKNNTFKNLLKNGILTTKDTRNTTIHKNIFYDIAKDVVASENGTQSSVGCVEFSFASEGNVGVIISNNVFNRTGLHQGSTIYYDEQSKIYAEETKEKFFERSYVNNSSIITLKSSAEDDLQVDGIIICTNNYGQALQNIRLNTQANNNIDQNGVLITEMF